MDALMARDPAAAYLKEAAYYINQITAAEQMNEIDYLIAEATGTIDTKDEENTAKASSALKKAADAIIRTIRNIISSISDFIKKLFMSSDERQSFDKMKRQIESNPEFRGKKLTVTSYEKIIAGYDDLIHETEAKIREVESNPNTKTDGLFNRITSFISGPVDGAIAVMTAEAAVRMASTNIEAARLTSSLLEADEGALSKSVSKYLGEKNTKKMKKELDACGSSIGLRRKLVQLRHGKFKTIQESVNSVVDDCMNLFKSTNKDMTKEEKKNLRKSHARSTSIVNKALNNDAELGLIVRTGRDTIINDKIEGAEKAAKSKIANLFKRK